MDKSNFIQEGYAILENVFTNEQIAELNELFLGCKPVYGMSRNKTHQNYAQDDVRTSSVWWSEPIHGKSLDSIIEKVNEKVSCIMHDLVLARVVFSVITAGSKQFYPHTDLPESANVSNYDPTSPIRAVQCLVPLDRMDHENGATALCPRSHTENYAHTESHETTMYVDMWETHNHIQPTVDRGSILIVDNRLLHCIMPNNTNTDRVALMLTWFDSELYEVEKQRMRIDNYER
jgi:ectoine hydroxylase-related dioxygenase (phytanoyl-CoA dioxygenase family)